MRSISAGFASGSGLAVALKALNFLDRPVDPVALCSTLYSGVDRSNFDWFAFSLGLITGICLYAVVEFLIALRWTLAAWVSGRNQAFDCPRPKPQYRIL